MNKGQFFFVLDDFYLKYDNERKLMRNKETVEGVLHNRPCFFAFNDNKNSDVFWCVPISSKTDKYQSIYDNKIKKQQMRGIAHPKCNTIRFGYVLGRKRAFLIQNMFPISEKYVEAIYLDSNTGNPVTIPLQTEKDIVKNACDIRDLVFHGNKGLVFADIISMYEKLCEEIKQDSLQQSDKVYLNDRLIKVLSEAQQIEQKEHHVEDKHFNQY